MDKQYYVYILASRKNGTLNIGFTFDLIKRVWEHKSKVTKGFTRKYYVNKLVYYEIFEDPENAIKREKRLKCYKRQWKIDLIEKDNPEWKDLYNEIVPGFFDQACPGNAFIHGRRMTRWFFVILRLDCRIQDPKNNRFFGRAKE